jgi:hypothetical protein
MNQFFGKISLWPPQKLCIQKMPLMNSDFCWLLIQPVLTYDLITMNFEITFQHRSVSGQTGYRGTWSNFWAGTWVKLTGVWIHDPKITSSAFQHLLKQTLMMSTATVMAISVQPCVELVVCCKIRLIERVWAFGTVTDSSKITTS